MYYRISLQLILGRMKAKGKNRGGWNDIAERRTVSPWRFDARSCRQYDRRVCFRTSVAKALGSRGRTKVARSATALCATFDSAQSNFGLPLSKLEIDWKLRIAEAENRRMSPVVYTVD